MPCRVRCGALGDAALAGSEKSFATDKYHQHNYYLPSLKRRHFGKTLTSLFYTENLKQRHENRRHGISGYYCILGDIMNSKEWRGLESVADE